LPTQAISFDDDFIDRCANHGAHNANYGAHHNGIINQQGPLVRVGGPITNEQPLPIYDRGCRRWMA
jgi:hypothetical protein